MIQQTELKIKRSIEKLGELQTKFAIESIDYMETS